MTNLVASIISSAESNISLKLTLTTDINLLTIFEKASNNVPSEIMGMFFWIVIILIIILILIVVFLLIILFWLKRQDKMHFPFKPKVIIRKERSLQEAGTTKNKGEETPTHSLKETSIEKPTTNLGIDKKGGKVGKVLKAKPVTDIVKSKKITAVTPVRITGTIPSNLEKNNK